MGKQQIYQIGRDPSCDIIIDDYTNVVSRSHATLRVDGNRYYITDHSSNGTYKNGIRLTSGVEYQVSKDDDISFGNVAFFDWEIVRGWKVSRISPVLVATLSILVTCIILGLVWYFVLRPNNKPYQEIVEEKEQVETAADTSAVKKPFEENKTESKKKKTNVKEIGKSKGVVKKNPKPVVSSDKQQEGSNNEILI